MKIRVNDDNKTINFQAENELDIYIVGILTGKFPESVSFSPGEKSPAEIRIQSKYVIDRLISP